MDKQQIAELASHPPIAEALRAAFGHVPLEVFEAIERPLRGRLSKASLFNLTVLGRRYLLRRVLGSGPENDARREFACMAIAAEHGVAPRVLYANAEQGVCITEFVEGVTLDAWLRAGNDCIETLGALIRKLHACPPFPSFMTIPAACAAIGGALRQRGAPPIVGELMASAEEARAALEGHVAEASCHNDLNPSNILVDRDRMWLIDWESGCVGDPFHDVATPGLFVLRTPEARARLLSAYLGREPNVVERSRAVLSRALGLTFYALVFTQAGLLTRATVSAAAEGTPSPTADPARFGEELAREAQRAFASVEHAEALVKLR